MNTRIKYSDQRKKEIDLGRRDIVRAESVTGAVESVVGDGRGRMWKWRRERERAEKRRSVCAVVVFENEKKD
jgi:hypothetical protein